MVTCARRAQRLRDPHLGARRCYIHDRVKVPDTRAAVQYYRLFVVFLFLTASLAGLRPARADSFDVDASAPIVGDGATEVRLPIKSAQGASIPASQVRATVSAGSIHVVANPKGTAELVFLPPAVVEKWTATLDVTVVGFKPSLRTARIRLVPPRHPLLYTTTRSNEGPDSIELKVPKSFILGEHGSAQITVRGFEEQPLLSVNTGRVSELRPKGKGTWTATFSPPEGGFPQRVLVVVGSEEGSQVHFTHFDLLGRPTIETQSEPGATVQVQVGGQTFGPMRADSRGKLRMMVLAPPGVVHADVTATDPLGNARAMNVPLGAPDFNRVQVFCPEHSGRFLVLGTAPDGTLLQTFDGKITASTGSLTDLIPVIPGLFESELSVPESTNPETKIQLQASLTGSPASVASCLTPVPGESPVAARLTPDRGEYHLDEGEVTLELKLTYPGELEPRPVAPRITADHGKVSDIIRVDASTFTARWTPPPRMEGVEVVRFTAQVGRTSVLSANAELPVLDSGPQASAPLGTTIKAIAHAGYLTNQERVSSPYLAVGASVSLPFLSHRVAAGLESGWFLDDRKARADTGEFVDLQVLGFPVSARLTFEERFDRLVPYGGIGFGVLLTRLQSRSPSTGLSGRSQIVPLGRVLVGALYDLPVGQAGIEGGYIHCWLRELGFVGEVCGVNITATYHYSF